MEVDGHDENEICEALKLTKESVEPVAIICHTIKGKGISFMENNILWHYRCPQGEDFDKALNEL
ncbi:MAG: transketolase [Microgenomates group bacterium Gr01-1014_93]|nr:MAG: transketolase [Microgenomates group bacterium Gr01-1014_93]